VPSTYQPHSAALAATYAEVENHALHQGEALGGTPGAISIRQNANGTRFYVRQYYDFDRRKRDRYLGPVGLPASEELAQLWRRRIAEENEIRGSIRLLAREGYALLSPKHMTAIAPLADKGVFGAGAVLVGTHAFEVIVNRLGVRAASFATEDVDLARPSRLAVENVPEGGLLEILRDSGIDFVDVPSLERGAPPTSFKERGRSRFTIDLLVPAAGDEIGRAPVPELKAHATSLPYLRYLIAETQMGAVISTHGAVAVRVPLAERFALHKLVVAQRRTGRPEKSRKDLDQAAALIAALGELQPGALEAAYAKVPASARKDLRMSLQLIAGRLAAHPQAWDEVATLANRRR
jgi:hypothetical protein